MSKNKQNKLFLKLKKIYEKCKDYGINAIHFSPNPHISIEEKLDAVEKGLKMIINFNKNATQAEISKAMVLNI